MARMKDYLINLEERKILKVKRKMELLKNIEGLFNPEDLEARTVTVGQLNNILGNDIALLKIIDVETKYNYPNSDLKGIKTDKVKFQTLEADTDIYIKVLTTKETYFLKVREELDYYNPAPVTLELLETLIERDRKKGFKHKLINPNRPEYEYLLIGSNGKTVNTRFRELIGIEFLVTGLGIEIDPRANILDNLIILNGTLKDYK